VREQRDLELELLALAATADAHGADLQLKRLRGALDADDAGIKRALVRLVDEHLIRERDGVVGGLHELRSRHIAQAIHDVPPPTPAETVGRVVDLLEADALQRFLTRLLLDNAVADEVVIAAAAARVEREPDARALAASLQALRLVGFRRMTVQWREIFADEGAAPTNVAIVAHFALHGGDDELFPEPIQRAVRRIRALDPPDPRPALLDRVTPHLSATFAAADVATAVDGVAGMTRTCARARKSSGATISLTAVATAVFNRRSATSASVCWRPVSAPPSGRSRTRPRWASGSAAARSARCRQAPASSLSLKSPRWERRDFACRCSAWSSSSETSSRPSGIRRARGSWPCQARMANSVATASW
jgi:hypothetical protein